MVSTIVYAVFDIWVCVGMILRKPLLFAAVIPSALFIIFDIVAHYTHLATLLPIWLDYILLIIAVGYGFALGYFTWGSAT